MSQATAADRKSVRAAEKAAKIADAERIAVVRQLMATTYGRGWVWDILESTHIFRTTHTGEALSAAFAEGERNVGLKLLADVMLAAPSEYLQMTREANERRTIDELSRSQNAGRDAEGSDPDDDASGSDDAPDHGNVLIDYASITSGKSG